MLRRWVLTGVALIVFLSGCGTDSRRKEINQTLAFMDGTTTKLKSLKEKVKAVNDKMIADKEVNDLVDPIKLCEQLKDFCTKEVQKHAQEIQSSRIQLTEAEKEEIKREFEGPINSKIQALNAETLALDAAIKELEKTVDTVTFVNTAQEKLPPEQLRKNAKEAVENLKKNFSGTQAEFESLNRKT